ncbi:MAG: translation initiation factor IF-3 [Alphaproteobacteria bacterium]|nr:translation initiation factor IF-3 [Alphaproteobacteria bacterium]
MGKVPAFVNNYEDNSIAKRPFAPTPVREGPRVNEEIQAAQVRLIDQDGNQLGVVSTRDAIGKAADAGLDLVEVAGNVDPPVCKILDYGKMKYESQKKKSEARKKQKTIDVKEIKFRPNIEQHDYEVKMKAMLRFLEEGDKVKVTLRFRGREMMHQHLGMKVLDRVRQETDEVAKVEQMPQMEGRQMIMVLSPR